MISEMERQEQRQRRQPRGVRSGVTRIIDEVVCRVAMLFFDGNLDEHGVAVRREDLRIPRIKAVRNMEADTRNCWGICEAEGDLDLEAGAGAG